MEFASGGLSDEQRESGPATGGIVSPQVWRVIEAGPVDCFIPLDRTLHPRALLEATARRMGFTPNPEGGENDK
jgi:hypothetical protein